MKITIEVIPHNQQRYNTPGDWQYGTAQTGKDIAIRVSSCENQCHELLLMIHELVEAWLCQQQGITSESVDQFDMKFTGTIEPGNLSEAPYHFQHAVASSIEEFAASTLCLDFADYEEALCQLQDHYRQPE